MDVEAEATLENYETMPYMQTGLLRSLELVDVQKDIVIWSEQYSRKQSDPSFARIHESLGLAYLRQKHYPEAIIELQKALELSPNDRQVIRDLGYGYAVAGRRGEALAVLKDLQARYEKHEAYGADAAAVYAGLGDRDQAFASLEKDLQTRTGRLGRVLYQIPFESLRSDPRYTDMRRRMGLPQ